VQRTESPLFHQVRPSVSLFVCPEKAHFWMYVNNLSNTLAQVLAVINHLNWVLCKI